MYGDKNVKLRILPNIFAAFRRISARFLYFQGSLTSLVTLSCLTRSLSQKASYKQKALEVAFPTKLSRYNRG